MFDFPECRQDAASFSQPGRPPRGAQALLEVDLPEARGRVVEHGCGLLESRLHQRRGGLGRGHDTAVQRNCFDLFWIDG